MQERAATLNSIEGTPPNVNEIKKLKPFELVEYIRAGIEILFLFKKQTNKQQRRLHERNGTILS